jgi:hypothetical protein
MPLNPLQAAHAALTSKDSTVDQVIAAMDDIPLMQSTGVWNGPTPAPEFQQGLILTDDERSRIATGSSRVINALNQELPPC